MRLKMILLFLLLGIVTSANANTLPELEEVIEKAMPSVVTVTTYKHLDQNLEEDSAVEIPKNLRHLFEAKEKSEVAGQTGTGFFVSKNGYIITCLHIMNGAKKIQVSLNDKRKFSAQIIASDSVTDLALLKIEGDNFHALDFELTKPPRIGAWVFTIGAPYGFEFSANVGIVSAINRALPLGEGNISYIQTSIPINPGHSGGPVVNLSGRVIGVSNYIFTDQPGSIGISFAVPASYAEVLSKNRVHASHTKPGN